MAYWVKEQPLGELSQAIDVGDVLRDDLVHPLRPPIFIKGDDVRRRSGPLVAAYDATGGDEGMYRYDVGPVVAGYRLARVLEQGLVSALSPGRIPGTDQMTDVPLTFIW
jgi:hypothetical protein